jgi:hypothetical protein
LTGPNRLLSKFAPGWEGVRTPGGSNTLTSLGIALLAAAGLCLILRYGRRLSARLVRPALARLVALAATGTLLAAILVEGSGPPRYLRVPPVPPAQLGAPAPQLHLPSDYFADLLYTYWSVAGFPQIVNGRGAFDPVELLHVREVARFFLDAASVAALGEMGVRTVILHRDLAPGSDWQNTALRPIAGLPLTREDKGDLVIYHLG